MSFFRHLLVALTALTVATTSAHAKTWTNTEGKIISATYIKVVDGKVHMRLRNGKLAKVALEKLSAKDQAWVKTKELELLQPNKETTPKTKPSTRPKIKPVGKIPFKDLGKDKTPKLSPIPPVRDDARIAVTTHHGEPSLFLNKEGKNAFLHLNITSHITAFSEDLAYIRSQNIGKKELKGYIDRNGHYVLGGDSGIPLPEGQQFKPFSDGLAMFTKGKRIGFMDTQGKVVIQPNTFYKAKPFCEGLAAVSTAINKGFRPTDWKYIDHTGKVILKSASEPWVGANSFKNGVAWVTVEKVVPYETPISQLINREGKVIIPGRFSPSDTSRQIFGNYVRVKGNIYNIQGKLLLEEFKEGWVSPLSDKDELAFLNGRNGHPSRLFHLPSQSVYGPEFTDVKLSSLYGYFTDGGLFPVMIGKDKNDIGWINRTGKVVIPACMINAVPFIEGFAVGTQTCGENKSKKRTIVINRKGAIIWKSKER